MPWYDKIPRYGYATSMTTPGIDNGLYLDDYDMSVIDYNTVTTVVCNVYVTYGM